MKPRRVRFTATAHRHVRREAEWWAAHRDHPVVFSAEFEVAVRVLELLPAAGTHYTDAGIAGLRRTLGGEDHGVELLGCRPVRVWVRTDPPW